MSFTVHIKYILCNEYLIKFNLSFFPVFLHFLIKIYFYTAHMTLVKSLSIKELKKYLHNYNINNYF